MRLADSDVCVYSLNFEIVGDPVLSCHVNRLHVCKCYTIPIVITIWRAHDFGTEMWIVNFDAIPNSF